MTHKKELIKKLREARLILFNMVQSESYKSDPEGAKNLLTSACEHVGTVEQELEIIKADL